MASEVKQLRKQAEKAARAAKAAVDVEVSEELQALARAFQSQADVLKAKKKAGKKRLIRKKRPKHDGRLVG